MANFDERFNMKKANVFQLLISLFLVFSCTTEEFSIDNLKCEYKTNPIGVDIETPRFNWIMNSSQRGAYQTAYRIIVSSTQENCKQDVGDIWDSKKVDSDKSNQIYFEGIELKSNSKYFWKVTVWNQSEIKSSSELAFWTTGLLNETDWEAKWIGLDRNKADIDLADIHTKLNARMLRYEFEVEKEIESATAFISGLGLFEFYVNGEKIGDQVLAPGLTEYDKRTFYMTFDVSKNLKKGKNAIGVILGNGR